MAKTLEYLFLISPFKESKFDKESLKRFQNLGETLVLSKDVDFYENLMEKYNGNKVPQYIVGLAGDGGNKGFGKFASEKGSIFLPEACGTGNDLPRSLGFSKPFSETSNKSISLLEEGSFETKKFDVIDFKYKTQEGVINDKGFIGVPFGILAEVGDVGTLTKKVFGNFAYVLNGIKKILNHKPLEVAIEVNNNIIYEGYISGGYALNTGTSGGGKFGVPNETPFDGEMCLVYFPTNKKAEKLKLLGLANNLSNCDKPSGDVEIIRNVKKFKVINLNSKKIPLGVDGEVLSDCYEVEENLLSGHTEMYVAPKNF